MSTDFSMGHETLKVSMQMYAENRAKLATELRANRGVDFCAKKTIILVRGGSEQGHYDTDTGPVFRQESNFHYLFGVREPDFYGALVVGADDDEKVKSVLFAPRLPESYAVWMGALAGVGEYRQRYEVDECLYVDELDKWIRDAQVERAITLAGVNSDGGKPTLEATGEDVPALCDVAEIDRDVLFEAISECRAVKSERELDVLRYAARVSSAAHNDVMMRARPGMTEYQLEAMFLEYAYARGGCRHVAYTCICASGPNAAVLHYGHAAAPNDRTFADGDMMMLDMGGEYARYASDISCSYPASGVFSERQRLVYEAVRDAQQAVFDALRPGVSWPDMHRLAERTMLRHLVDNLGVLRGDVDAMLEARVGAIFMPHGLGHLLGLDVHDVGGYLSDTPKRSTEPGLRSLRTARALKAGMVLTVEPGLYFVDTLLDQALAADSPIAHCFVTEALEAYRGFGGVRLEDDVAITNDGHENFTRCPRTIEEIEAMMAKGRELYGKELPFVAGRFD
jgi:Xaa-Pro dipeptidase